MRCLSNIMKRTAGTAAALTGAVFIALIAAFPAFAAVEKPEIAAEGAAVYNVNKGEFLFEKNGSRQLYPASITKIMTALLVVENTSPEEIVTFSETATTNLESGAVALDVVAGDRISVNDCLYGLMLKSANEVANGLAEHVGGSVPGFAEMMNARAAALGCTNTHFVNPNGLNNSSHYTSAHDMCLIAAEAFRNQEFRNYAGTLHYHFPATIQRSSGTDLTMGHKMINPSSEHYRTDVVGGKTGYTRLAGNTLVTCSERDGVRLIAVVLKSLGTHYADTKKLLDYGYALEAEDPSPALAGGLVTVSAQALPGGALPGSAVPGSSVLTGVPGGAQAGASGSVSASPEDTQAGPGETAAAAGPGETAAAAGHGETGTSAAPESAAVTAATETESAGPSDSAEVPAATETEAAGPSETAAASAPGGAEAAGLSDTAAVTGAPETAPAENAAAGETAASAASGSEEAGKSYVGAAPALTVTGTADSASSAAAGWVKKDGFWYWYGEDGRMAQSEHRSIDGSVFWFDASGRMMTGWQEGSDGKTYYLRPSGQLKTSAWLNYADRWYYLGSDGALLKNTTTPDGYHVDEQGVCVD